MRIQGDNSLALAGKVNSGAHAPVRIEAVAQPTDVAEVFGSEIVRAIETTNEKLLAFNSRAEFSVHEKTGDIMIKILDVNTNEVIREIPPKKIVDMIANILERAGLLIDKRA